LASHPRHGCYCLRMESRLRHPPLSDICRSGEVRGRYRGQLESSRANGWAGQGCTI
jgi:hypothetical protein